SYTNFKFSKKELRNNLNSKNNSIDISLNVKNNGKISGKEVVQAYVSAPNGKLSKPSIELKAFAKTKELKSKESQKISMSIDQSTLASYNSENSKWVIEKGLYKVYISSSSDVRNVKPMKFYVKKDIIVDDVTNVMSPTEDVLMNRNHK
ncbi:MAG: fibronectin type III-like domain-contianing protein, partial [Clostridiales bacterium]